jgi:class 3 adenylate cyclase
VAQARRKNEKALVALRAGGIALTTTIGLAAMSARPAWLPLAVGLAVAAIALASTELAVLVGVIALCVPLIAVQPVLGFTMLIILVACVRFLGADGGRGYLILGLSLVGAFLGPVWAGVALAGYLLGAGEGALAAVMACLIVEAVGIALGRPMIGATVTGGTANALVSFARMPESLLSVEWIARSFTSLDAKAVTKTINGVSHVSRPLMLVLQPCVWALGAVAAGMISENARKKHSLALNVVAVTAGVAIPALGGAALATALGLPVVWQWVAMSFFASLIVAVVFVVIWESAFTPLKVVKKSLPRKASMATEDADVDELLRLIATAEDKLATNHTSVRVVMITDMKSFSRMTEEDGSVATAKAIQRHRDLLLPIIQGHNGAGKSTGGDGLVSAFESASDALLAAVDMQRALGAHNTAHPDEREIWVRMGIAAGEVVLDKGGRPFIGAGLNLAARVMNLADGGQIFATAGVGDAAAAVSVPVASFGEFELKNIARPVEIVEVLWSDGQEPRDPRDTGTALYDAPAE